MAYEVSEEAKCIPETEAAGHWHCSARCNHLVVGAMAVSIDLHIVSALYSSSLLLRTGGYFLRLVLAAQRLVHERATRLASPTPAEASYCCQSKQS